MTARLTASIYSAGKPIEPRHLGVWNPEWTKSGDARMQALARSVDEMQRAMEEHKKRALERVERGEPEDWRTKVRAPGDKFSRNVTAVRDGLKLSHKHLVPAVRALEDAHDSAAGLNPYTRTESPADAITRASIRARLVQMDDKQRGEYLRQATLSNTFVQAVLEVDPQMSGFRSDSLAMKNFRERAIEHLHGDKLRQLEALAGAASYAVNLCQALESAMRAEAVDFGLRPDEVADFIEDALAA